MWKKKKKKNWKNKNFNKNEVKRLFEKYNEIFDTNAYTGYLSKNNEIWKSYTDKRKSWATYRPFRPDYESRKATEDTVKIYIKELLNLKKDNKLELNDIEIISLSAILDEVDYKFAACLMFYPSPVNMIEERIFKADDEKVLVRIVNGLVKYYDVNPFEIEKKT